MNDLLTKFLSEVASIPIRDKAVSSEGSSHFFRRFKSFLRKNQRHSSEESSRFLRGIWVIPHRKLGNTLRVRFAEAHSE